MRNASARSILVKTQVLMKIVCVAFSRRKREILLLNQCEWDAML